VIDLVFCAHNRLRFTELSLQHLMVNTNWSLVDRLVVYDDSSIDGTSKLISGFCRPNGAPSLTPAFRAVRKVLIRGEYGGPVAIMNDFLARDGAAVFAKIDNDVIVPPRWLDICMSSIETSPFVDLLGIEPPLSRKAGAPWNEGRPIPMPELECDPTWSAAVCDAIGGIGLMRRSAFRDRATMRPFATYGGFTDWQLAQRDVVKAWVNPPLKVFLLDRLPFDPFLELSREYMANGWQRPWTLYDPADSQLWDWALSPAF
jgi:hypothetical protein